MKKNNTVEMIVDRVNLTVKFVCEGDVWEWHNKGKSNSLKYDILQYVLHEEVKSFYYETKLNKFIKRFTELAKVKEGEIKEGRTNLQVHCGA